MSKIVPFAFMAPARIGNDQLIVDTKDIQNADMASYQITPPTAYNLNETSLLATSQPGLIYSSGAGGSAPYGSNIDLSSAVRGHGLDRPPGHISLTPRMFATVPYLGRGTVDTDAEQLLRTGQSQSSRPSVALLTEKNFSRYSQMPLLPEAKQRFADTSRYIEQDADSNWVRGGYNARQ